MATRYEVLIIGAGIGGMTLAHGLASAGMTVRVVEASQRSAQLGTGITLLGNALRALDRVGLADPCLAHGAGWDVVSNRDPTGKVLHEVRPPRTFRADAPGALGIMRPVLADILETHALASGARIDYATKVEDFEQHGSGVHYRLSNGDSGSCDLLVAADGTYSKTRARVFGDEFKPAYAGQGGWRYTVERSDKLDGLALYRTGDGHSIGGLPLSDRLCYYFLLENTPEHVRVDPERMCDLLRERFAPFSAPELREAAARIDGTRHISYRPYDILLMPQPWYKGRVVLLGDAAHSMTPQMTSGGGMAIEDAVVLSEELAARADITQALAAYCERRGERVRRVFETSLAVCRSEQSPTADGRRSLQLLMEGHAALGQPF